MKIIRKSIKKSIKPKRTNEPKSRAIEQNSWISLYTIIHVIIVV